MIKSYSGILTVIFCFLFNLSQGATYYNRTGSTSPTATASWTTSATGGAGTSPGSFTASGDIFIIRSGTTMTQGQADWTIGSGVTLDIRGTLKIGNGSTYCCGVLCLSTCYAYYGLVMNTNAYLYVRNGGVLEIVNDYLDGCTFQFPSVARTTFEPTSTMLFTDGAGKFNPSYTYGHLTFNDNTGSPPVLTSALNVQSDLTVANVNANWIMSTTGSLTHNIGGSFIFTAPDNDIIVFDNGTGAPVYNIGGDFRFDAPCAGSIRFNNGASGTPVLNLTGSLTMNATGDFDANGSPDASFAGTSWTGNATLNIGGNVNANTYGAIHFSNEYGCTTAGCTTIGATTAYISGSIIVSSSGHVDLGYNILGGANMIYVSGSATVAAGGILVGPHGMGKTDGLVPTLIFRSPASGIATGNLSMTTGDMEGAAANCNSGSGQFNVVIQANRIITLLSDIDLGNNRTFTVNAGGTLNTGTAGGTAYTIRRRLNDGTTYATGTTFTLSATSGGLYSEIQANATPNALMASAYSGNIQTNTRVYSPSANYRFNATGAQSTGDFMTSASNGGRVNKLIVNNTSGTITTGLTLSNALTITSDLTFVAGRLKTTTTNLPTIDVSGTSSGYAFSTANTAYVDGPVAKNSNSTTEFNLPTGSSAANLFRPIAYSPASSSATTYQVQLYGGYMGGVLLTLLNWVCPVFYWDSRYISGSAIANVKLYYVSSDLSTAPVPGSHYYATTTQFNFNGLLQWVNMGSSGSDSLSSMNWIRSQAQPSFSLGKYLAVGQAIAPLPVELGDFSGRSYRESNILKWNTVTELNNDYFTLEKSSDGINFTELCRVKGKGTSHTASNYTAIDKHPVETTFYRLKQTDFDGLKREYTTISVKNPQSAMLGNFKIYQRTTENKIVISFNSSSDFEYTIRLYDITGRESMSRKGYSESGYNEALLEQVSPGTYIITLEKDGLELMTQKLIYSR